MRSTRESSKKTAPVSNEVMHQQIVSRIDHMMDLIAPDAAAADPISTRQTQAMELLQADQDAMGLTDDEVASMAMVLSSRPGVLAPYLCLKREAGRRAFILKNIEQEERGL